MKQIVPWLLVESNDLYRFSTEGKELALAAKEEYQITLLRKQTNMEIPMVDCASTRVFSSLCEV